VWDGVLEDAYWTVFLLNRTDSPTFPAFLAQ
jgi:hypothetical protein